MSESIDQQEAGLQPTDSASRPAGRWNLAILLALLLTLIYMAVRSPAPAEGWLTNFDEARSQAVASGRMVLVKFTLPGCPACVVMERTVLREPEVIDALASFVPVQLDGTRVPHLAQRYGVYAAPSFVVTDEQGEALRRTEGIVSVREFLAFLRGPVTPTASGVPNPADTDLLTKRDRPVGP